MRKGWNHLSIADQPGDVFAAALDEREAVFSCISSEQEKSILSNSFMRAA